MVQNSLTININMLQWLHDKQQQQQQQQQQQLHT